MFSTARSEGGRKAKDRQRKIRARTQHPWGAGTCRGQKAEEGELKEGEGRSVLTPEASSGLSPQPQGLLSRRAAFLL